MKKSIDYYRPAFYSTHYCILLLQGNEFIGADA